MSPTCFFFTALGAQKVETHEVTGNVGDHVLLPCHFIQKPKIQIIQSQWTLLEPDGNGTVIAVSSSQHGEIIHESPLKGRVKTVNLQLEIKNVSVADAGLYTCTITAFPVGSFEKTIKLDIEGE